MDYFFAGIFPERGVEAIQDIRRKYDPTVAVVAPHITVLFPVPESVGEADLLSHLEAVCARRSPFEIRLGGFHRSDDHWLFLTLVQGAEEVRSLYLDAYSGILGQYRRADIHFVPHVGLGLFVQEGRRYQMGNPDSAPFDEAAYSAALAEAALLEFNGPELANALRVCTRSDSPGWMPNSRLEPAGAPTASGRAAAGIVATDRKDVRVGGGLRVGRSWSAIRWAARTCRCAL